MRAKGDLTTAVRQRLAEAYRRLKNWRAVGREFGISEGMAWRLVNEAGYEPKDAHIRVRLGLPALMPAPVCGRCGEVHVAKRCLRERTARAGRWRDMPVEAVRRAILEREEV